MKIATKQNWQFFPEFKPDALEQMEAMRKKIKSSVAIPGQSAQPRDTLRLKDKVKVPGSADATPQTKEATAKEPAMEKSEESTKQLYDRLLGALLETLTPEEAISLFREAREQAGSEDPTEPHLAVLVQNRTTQILKSMRPGASILRVKEAAKSDPKIAQTLKLTNSAKAYLKAVREQQPQPSLKNKSLTEETGESGASEAQKKKPYHLDPKKQAELMAENHKTLTFIADIHAKMATERRKSIEKISQMNRETNRSINDMWADFWANRQISQDKHFRAFLKII